MSSDDFGIGLVGAGFISREAHAPSVEYIPDARIAGIQNRTRENASSLAADCNQNGNSEPSIYGDGEIKALATDPDVDAIWVTTPNFTRLNAVKAVIEAVEDGADLQGIAVEKPIGRTVKEGNRLLELVDRVDLPHAYLENWPHEPDVGDMRSLLWEQGRDAGRPYIARSQAEHGGPHSGWFWDGRKQGGGALTDMLCHALANNEILLSDPNGSPPKAVSVTANTGTLKWDRNAYAEELEAAYDINFATDPVDDYASATIQYEDANGRPVISEASGSWCYVGSGVRRTIELLGPEYSGQVLSDETSSSVFFSDDLSNDEGWAEKQNATSGRMPVSAAEVVKGGYVAENRNAIESFRDEQNARLDLDDGCRILRLCMAAYKAAETGQEVDPRATDLTEYVPFPARK
ncbi:Gfo/Idh/MocA family protein [Saliphagus infecundisoli]|uniref:Gfo/Idh/MocA family protein n=1 Tax=Saliphagus infecundisoli TaxID=1849069 RepID=A0ABD5QAY2_9EURY|nr:Gfo/Idh/MocA family oxidoreductase [Saliphagus infecundisoli]